MPPGAGPRSARPCRPSPWCRSSASGLADRWASLSSRPCLPCSRKNDEQQGPFAPRALLRFVATTSPSATLSPSADFPVLPVIRPTQLPPFPVGTRRASPVAGCVLVVVPSLTTPRERPAPSIGLGRVMLPSPSRLRARPPGLLTFGATTRSLSLRPEQLAPTPRVGSSRGFRPLVSRRPALPATGLPILTPTGLTPAEHTGLSWTHSRSLRFRVTVGQLPNDRLQLLDAVLQAVGLE